jgi:hypothetical protein
MVEVVQADLAAQGKAKKQESAPLFDFGLMATIVPNGKREA